MKHSFLIEIELNGLNRRDASFIELDDGKIYRKAPYLMGKSIWFPVNFPLNQSNDSCMDCLRLPEQ